MTTRSNDRNWFNSLYLLVLIPCAVIRFALFAPLGYYWTHSNNHWDLIKGHAELLDGGFDSAIAMGEKLAARWGTFTFYWNFAVWVPTFWFPPPLNLPFTVIDSVATGYLSWTTHYQTGYVPHSKVSCKGAAYSWHRPAGANETFFETAGRLNTTVASPVDMCKSFVEEWQYGVAISFFYALISLANIIAFFGAVSDARKQGETTLQLFGALGRGIIGTIVGIFKILGLLLALIFWWIPEFFFRCLPRHVSTNARFSRRYVLKAWLGFGQTTELGVIELKDVYKHRKRDKHPRVQCDTGERSPLSNFLSIYDMLMVVTEELHYLDVMNLSRVSKSVRDAVLPADDFNRRIDTFKRYTCQADDKEDCWVCDKQICATCRCTPEIREATLSHHLHNCRPYCTKCHKNHIVKRRRGRANRTQSPYCKCAPAPRNPNFFQRWLNGDYYYSSKQWNLPKAKRHVCRECISHSKTGILDMREHKTKMELKRGMTDGKKWTKCDKCKENLGTGPRWWICGISNCGLECRSTVHKGWGRKMKDGSSTPVGDEAV